MRSEVSFSQKSMMDDFGRVFFANSKVYRAIHNTQKTYCISLLNSELFVELSAKFLIPKTVISDFKIDGYDLVLEHEKLLDTIQHEWTFDMIRDIALVIFEVNQICNKYGFELKDAHLHNVLFRGTQAMWIDFGSIAPKSTSEICWVAYEEYLQAVIVPLLFWSENKYFIAHKLLESIYYGMKTIPAETLVESGLLELLSQLQAPYKFKLRSKTLFKTRKEVKPFTTTAAKTQSLINNLTNRNTRLFSYKRDFDSISSIIPQNHVCDLIRKLPEPDKLSAWQAYHRASYQSEDNQVITRRFQRIIDIIENLLNVNTIIDLAGNEGYFTKLLVDNLVPTQVILADYDENAINFAYLHFKKLGYTSIHPILLNFMYTPDLEGTANRLRSDLVVALAVTHHLILTAKYSLASIFDRLKSFSKKYVIVEFMPLGLWSDHEKQHQKLPDWYNVDWFRMEFTKYFHIELEEQLEENRVLFCGKISGGN